MQLTDKEKKKPLAMKQVMKVMADPSILKEQEAIKVLSTKPDITSQIEEFFKTGGAIKEMPQSDRAMPEWTWWQDNYPKNYRR